MKARRAVALSLLAGGLLVAAFRPAAATHACVSYSITAPGVGTLQDTKCTISPFTQPFWFQQCQGVPPAGTTVCATVDADTP